MFKRGKVASITAALGMVLALGAVQNTAVPQKSAVPKPQDNLALAEGDVRRLMLLIAPNEKGKLTKQEWMKFMEAEFDRLDKDKSGELDAKELAQSRLQVSSFSKLGK
jgi:EF hand domain-containing protein